MEPTELDTITLNDLKETLADHPDTPIYVVVGFNRYRITSPLNLHKGYITIDLSVDDVDNPKPKK